MAPAMAMPPPPMAIATPPVPPMPSAAQQATSHILQNLMKLHQEANLAVTQQSNLLTSLVLTKEREARDAIEKEIPLAAANDTAEISKDVAAQQQELQKGLARSSFEANEALVILKNQTENAVTLSAVLAVRNVEKQAEEGVIGVGTDSIQLQAEAAALANEASGAANFSLEAAKNSALWVNELPLKDAKKALDAAAVSERRSVHLRHEYEDVKRMAKLSGNMALNTMAMAKEATRQATKAKLEATLTAEQAAQNALLLNTIRDETKKATDTSMFVVSQIQ